jgi:hypothetical protein
MIDSLPTLTPNPDRAARTIARAHARLTHHRQRLAAEERESRRRAVTIERAVGATFCVLYAAAVIFNAIRIMAHA